MKRITAAILAMAVAMVSLQGCYGKMALTKKVYRVNGEVGDKFLRSLVTWVFIIVPVYGISALVDFVLFNTIEFWTGSNPVALGEKNFQYSENGDSYRINARKNGDIVTYTFNHYRGDAHLDTLSIDWNVKSGNSVASFKEAGHVTQYQASLSKGGVQVTSSGHGVHPVQESVAFYK